MKNVLLVATTLALATASMSSAFARSHERGASMPTARTQSQAQGLSYATSDTRYRAATGANPYTHQFPSTDGSDR